MEATIRLAIFGVMMRITRLVSLVLLTAMLAVAGRFPLFHAYLKSLKAEFRSKVFTQAGLHVIKKEIGCHDLFVDSGSMNWKDNNRELVVNGIFYEVVKITRHRAKATLYLIEDKYESSLYAGFLSGEHNDDMSLWCYLLGSLQTVLPSHPAEPFPSITGVNHAVDDHRLTVPGYLDMRLRPPCL